MARFARRMERRRPADVASPPEVDYAALRRDLLRCVRAVCPAWLGADAEDICQQAMVKVMATVERNDGSANLPPRYLQRVAYSATIDELRRRRVREHDRADDRGVRRAITERADPEERVLLREMGHDMAVCLQGLEQRRRLAVTLHLQGLVRSEVAHVLGWTVKQAENRIYRGLANLRRCLSSKGHNP